MAKLTKEELSRVVKGDVLFEVNPYSNSNQSDVTIQTIIVNRIENGEIIGFTSSALQAATYRSYSGFFSDMCNDLISTFLDLEEAMKYLELVKSREFEYVVTKHHNSCK